MRKKTIKKDDNEQIRVLIPRDALEQVDKFVSLIPNMKRAQLISNLVLMGLDDVKVLNSLGLLTASRVARAILTGAAEVLRKQDVSLKEK